MVGTDACRRATWVSRAIVTLSRKRRCTRVLTVRRNQVAVADRPRPIAEPIISVGRCSTTAVPSSISHSARRAAGRGEIGELGSGEDVIRLPLLLWIGEALRLQLEHRAIAAAAGQQLVVGAELDHRSEERRVGE